MAASAITVFHNIQCSKCRGVLEILKERGEEPTLVAYLDTPPDRATLEGILDRLDAPPSELVRRDKRFEELGLDDAACASREQVVELLLAHPEVMQRPVVVRGDRAVIARPPDRVVEILG